MENSYVLGDIEIVNGLIRPMQPILKQIVDVFLISGKTLDHAQHQAQSSL